MKACIKYYFFSHGSCKSSLAVGLSSGNQESVLRRNRRKPCLSLDRMSSASKVRVWGIGAARHSIFEAIFTYTL